MRVALASIVLRCGLRHARRPSDKNTDVPKTGRLNIAFFTDRRIVHLGLSRKTLGKTQGEFMGQ